MICYKVVRIHSGRFVSAIVARGPCQLTYRVGKVTLPPVGALFAFTSLDHARYFRRRLEDSTWWLRYVILEGHGARSRRKLPSIIGFHAAAHLRRLVAKLWTGRRDSPELVWPRGTVLLTKFTPIREV